jgi:hypothetical protein
MNGTGIISEEESEPTVTFRMYEPSTADYEGKKPKYKPLANGKVGFIIFGKGNGEWDDDMGSKANVNMKLYVIDFDSENTNFLDVINAGRKGAIEGASFNNSFGTRLDQFDKIAEGGFDLMQNADTKYKGQEKEGQCFCISCGEVFKSVNGKMTEEVIKKDKVNLSKRVDTASKHQ